MYVTQLIYIKFMKEDLGLIQYDIFQEKDDKF